MLFLRQRLQQQYLQSEQAKVCRHHAYPLPMRRCPTMMLSFVNALISSLEERQ